MSEGWIPVQRAIRNHWLWAERRRFSRFEAFLDLWLAANHTPTELMIASRVVKLIRGGLLTSQLELSRRWRWTRKSVNKFLKRLNQVEIIRFETVIRAGGRGVHGRWTPGMDTGYTVVTIRNFEDPLGAAQGGVDTGCTHNQQSGSC